MRWSLRSLGGVVTVATAAVLAACGGDSSGDDDDDVPGGGAPRLWERELIQELAASPGLGFSGGGTIDLVYTGSAGGVAGLVWQEVGGGASELIEAGASSATRPAVARDAAGVVHVAWQTDASGGTSGEIRYAQRGGPGWSVESVAGDRFRPDLAVAAGGTPHLVFVDEATGSAMAYHAVRDAGGWQITPVHPTDWFAESQAGIVMTAAGTPIVAAPNDGRMGVWVAEPDGAGGWTVQALAEERPVSGVLALASGAAGTALAFKDGQSTVVAWRAAGDAAWSIENASRHDADAEPMDVLVGAGGPIVVADVDVQYPNALAVLERTSAGWIAQEIGPRSCGSGGLAATVDATGEPVVALVCFSNLYLMTVIGRYPADWPEQCEAAAAEMCGPACGCGVDGEQCCWGLGGNSTCTSSFGCPINAVSAMCGDPTVTPAALQACRDELPSLTCSASGPLDLSGACAALYQPFQ